MTLRLSPDEINTIRSYLDRPIGDPPSNELSHYVGYVSSISNLIAKAISTSNGHVGESSKYWAEFFLISAVHIVELYDYIEYIEAEKALLENDLENERNDSQT